MPVLLLFLLLLLLVVALHLIVFLCGHGYHSSIRSNGMTNHCAARTDGPALRMCSHGILAYTRLGLHPP